MEKKTKGLSAKSTKNEILNAYQELMAKYEDNAGKVADKKAEIKAAADSAIVAKASAYTGESIVRELAELKLNIGKTLTGLAEQLTDEANKLTEIKQAIEIETKHLEELHDIKIAADTLANLIQAQEERKRVFEAEMAQAEERHKNEVAHQRTEWAKEQAEHALAVKERDLALKKESEREKEEYEYNLTLSRKKDKDTYEEKQAALKKALAEEKLAQERDLAEREAKIATREKEFAELKAKVEAYPTELSEAVKKAEKAALAAAENQAKTEAKLLAKEVEGDTRLAELKIAALEETIAKQNAQIQVLTKQLNEASAQAQNIALRVIEGHSDAKALKKVNEIALQQAKNPNTKG